MGITGSEMARPQRTPIHPGRVGVATLVEDSIIRWRDLQRPAGLLSNPVPPGVEHLPSAEFLLNPHQLQSSRSKEQKSNPNFQNREFGPPVTNSPDLNRRPDPEVLE